MHVNNFSQKIRQYSLVFGDSRSKSSLRNPIFSANTRILHAISAWLYYIIFFIFTFVFFRYFL